MNDTLIRAKRDISSAWDETVDAIRNMEEEYDQKINTLEEEIEQLKERLEEQSHPPT